MDSQSTYQELPCGAVHFGRNEAAGINSTFLEVIDRKALRSSMRSPDSILLLSGEKPEPIVWNIHTLTFSGHDWTLQTDTTESPITVPEKAQRSLLVDTRD